MRLGETLINKGMISQDQLNEALEAQLIYGGHLGTCLIELGFLQEPSLGEVLAETFSVQCAPNEVLVGVSRGLIAKLPAKLVEKYCAIPFRLQDKILDVAMIDPSDLAGVDELSFASGHKVRAWIAPEARIFQAMERYYGIPRRLRYITLCRQLDQGPSLMQESEVDRELMRIANEQAGPEPERERELPPEPPAFVSSEEPGKPDRTVTDGDALREVTDRMCRADTSDALADAILWHAARSMSCCILFKVKSGVASLWRAGGLAIDAREASKIRFPIISEPLFGLLRGAEFFKGPLPEDPGCLRFYQALQREPPKQLMLAPVYLEDRLVALFYGDSGRDTTIHVDEKPYRRLVRKLAMALNLVMLKRKMRFV